MQCYMAVVCHWSGLLRHSAEDNDGDT